MPHDKKPKPKRKKVAIMFDDKTRSEYLSGFHKRKQQRRVKAQTEIAQKLKQKIREERNKNRKKMKKRAEDVLAGVYGIEKLIGEEADTATEKVEFENHEVFVNTEMDLGDSGFLLSTNEETAHKEKTKEDDDQEEVTKKLPARKKKRKFTTNNNKHQQHQRGKVIKKRNK